MTAPAAPEPVSSSGVPSACWLSRRTLDGRATPAAYRSGAGCAVATSPTVAAQLVPPSGGPLTTGQVASLSGVTRSAVTRAIREGRLRAERVAGRWLIDVENAARYRAS
jgi:excisionase family DNA binding protein